MGDRRRDDSMLFADDSHNESRAGSGLPPIHVKGMSAVEGQQRGLHRIAGGVMFDTPSDQPPVGRARGRGRAVAESRSPTAKPLPKLPAKRRPRSRSLVE